MSAEESTPDHGGSESAPAPGQPPAALADPEARARVLDAFVEMVAERGYMHTRVRELTARSGVARAVFYELFENKEACFLAAQQRLRAKREHEVGAAVAAADPSTAAQAALAALVELAERERHAFTFLTHEATLAGPRPAQEREAMIATIAQAVERAWERAAAGEPIPDAPAMVLLWGAIRVLGIHLRRGEDAEKVLADVSAWVDSYKVPAHARRWKSIASSRVSLGGDQELMPGPIEPAPLPRGRHRLPTAVSKRSQRERILHAAAKVTTDRGYEKATVADIVAAAGVSREVFYEHFGDKQEAFAETIKFVFEQIMAASAGAFFTVEGPWPERVWRAGEAFTGFIVGRPSLAASVFVESYAVAADLQRSDEFMLGFTVFLEDGYRHRPEAQQLPRIAGEAVGGAVLESIIASLRDNRTAELPAFVPLIAYVILAPFMGTEAAYQFVARKAGEGEGERSAPSEA